ncbi:hypothetical protein P154DRAFT_94585 [Amniculicola lignicola CBS 123094]|uniref:C2H2-type domain-containing protein n=1 Tax=Amniculicola lignicola CBS 123094 TaxID=1392246 RepID=A0A6A5WTH8_9PLEO|nr:hypothetical protein P154DRAFT_94585 [Amniculicola lignicola CBS 123094]
MAASARAITPTPTHGSAFAAPNRPTTPGTTALSLSRTSNAGATFGAHLTKSPRGLSPRHSPQPLTGAAALGDNRRAEQEKARQTNPNPAVAVVQNLLGHSQAHPNRPKDGPPPPTTMSAQLEKAAESLVIPERVTGDNMQTSPVSLSSFGSADSTTAATATALEATAGPASLSTPDHQPHPHHHHQPIALNPGDAPNNRAFTFPGPLPPEHDPRAPTRQLSLPGYQNSPKSPSTKRHKCPYCATDFTRHHNLKSHLLTHSQEKPYECPTCQARFRRLHDLKRHTKLHTGERPHNCAKCGRRFARGDALARHNKGQGGCAGRRSSFGIDEDMVDGKGDDSMDGVVYQEPEGMDDDSDGGRRASEPARKRQNTGNSTQAPSNLSSLQYAHSANMFAQGSMTESPKPISPGQMDHHRLGALSGHHEGSIPNPRSPNMAQQVMGRNAGRGSSPMALALPHSNAPHLPSLPGLNPMIPKQGSQGGSKNGPSMLQHQQMPAPGTASQPGSMSSHGGSGGSLREITGGQSHDFMANLREVEARMVRMEQDHKQQLKDHQERQQQAQEQHKQTQDQLKEAQDQLQQTRRQLQQNQEQLTNLLGKLAQQQQGPQAAQ